MRLFGRGMWPSEWAGECDPQNGQGNVTLGMGAWLAPVLCVDGMQKERTTR